MVTCNVKLFFKYLFFFHFELFDFIQYRYIELQELDELNFVNFFDSIKFLSRNTLGRELAWDYFRLNYQNLLEKFGYDDPRLGQALIDISSTFENEFLFFEVSNIFNFFLLENFILPSFFFF